MKTSWAVPGKIRSLTTSGGNTMEPKDIVALMKEAIKRAAEE